MPAISTNSASNLRWALPSAMHQGQRQLAKFRLGIGWARIDEAARLAAADADLLRSDNAAGDDRVRVIGEFGKCHAGRSPHSFSTLFMKSIESCHGPSR